MSTTLIEKVKLLPPDKQQELEDYADFLLHKYQRIETKSYEEIAEKRRRNFGNMKGQIWMSDDFNETPEDFKVYM
jgi:hypothetical protein